MTTNQWIFIFIVIIIILILLWLRTKKEAEVKKKKPQEIIGTYEGWMITWAKTTHLYPEVRGENAMLLLYGRADVYADGFMESIPDSYRLTYKQEGEIIRRFNPYYDQQLLAAYRVKNNGQSVKFCDGTQRYLAQIFGVRKGYVTPNKHMIQSRKNVGGG